MNYFQFSHFTSPTTKITPLVLTECTVRQGLLYLVSGLQCQPQMFLVAHLSSPHVAERLVRGPEVAVRLGLGTALVQLLRQRQVKRVVPQSALKVTSTLENAAQTAGCLALCSLVSELPVEMWIIFVNNNKVNYV